jgi:hypothetical protein
MPSDLLPGEIAHQQSQRWTKTGVLERKMVHDLRVLFRLAERRQEQLTAAIFDSRTLQSSQKAVIALVTMAPSERWAVKPTSL